MFSIKADIALPRSGGRRAVIADDDPAQRATLARHLAERGFAVSEAADGFTALSIIGEEAPAIALLHRPDEEDGDRAAALASLLYPHTRIIMTVSQPDVMPENSPFTLLTRPVDLRALDRCLDALGS
ncbi:response regulator [Azospirillum sp. sgz302134]